MKVVLRMMVKNEDEDETNVVYSCAKGDDDYHSGEKCEKERRAAQAV